MREMEEENVLSALCLTFRNGLNKIELVTIVKVNGTAVLSQMNKMSNDAFNLLRQVSSLKRSNEQFCP